MERGNKVEENKLYFQTGCTLVDMVTGGAKDVFGLPAGRITNVVGDKSAGKAQPLYSKVLTPDGWKAMGEIKVGDKVIGLQGKPVEVIGVYPQGKRPIYEFEFQDHTTVRSADSHLWRIQTPNQYHDKTQFGKGRGFSIVTTQEIVDNWEEIKLHPSKQIYIPKHKPIEFEEKKLPIHPWLLGILIAEGSLTNAKNGNIDFSNGEADVIEKAKNIVSSMPNHQLHSYRDDNNNTFVNTIVSINHTRTGISNTIVELGLNVKSIQKHIPSEYLRSSIQQRIELLQGLFDGDGYVAKGGSLEYSTSSKQLAENVAELVRSLGGMAICRKCESPFYIKNGQRIYCNDSYTITICLDDSSWVASSKKHSAAVEKNKSLKKSYWKWTHAKMIKDVRYIGEEECQCIYLADPDHCYITDGNTVTHNTFLCNEIIASNHYKYGDKFKWMYDDCEAGYSFDTKSMYGFDIVTPESNQSTKVEEAFYNITKFIENLKDDEFGVYVLDSLDALTSDEADTLAEERIKAYDNDKDFDKGSYKMGKAKYLSQEFFPQLCRKLENKNVLLIIISQVRDNMDMFSFEKYVRAGGKALDFYCSHIVWLATAQKILKKETPVGGAVKLKLTKGKVARPFRECFYSFYFSYGIDDIGSNLDYLFDLRTDNGSLSSANCKSIAWEKDESKLEVNSANVRKFLQDNKKYEQAVSTCNNNRFDLGTVIDFINKDEELSKLFDEQFEKVMSRDSLISYIENNNLQDELKRRVIQKWEDFEDSISVKRVKKYATQPVSTE